MNFSKFSFYGYLKIFYLERNVLDCETVRPFICMRMDWIPAIDRSMDLCVTEVSYSAETDEPLLASRSSKHAYLTRCDVFNGQLDQTNLPRLSYEAGDYLIPITRKSYSAIVS